MAFAPLVGNFAPSLRLATVGSEAAFVVRDGGVPAWLAADVFGFTSVAAVTVAGVGFAWFAAVWFALAFVWFALAFVEIALVFVVDEDRCDTGATLVDRVGLFAAATFASPVVPCDED